MEPWPLFLILMKQYRQREWSFWQRKWGPTRTWKQIPHSTSLNPSSLSDSLGWGRFSASPPSASTTGGGSESGTSTCWTAGACGVEEISFWGEVSLRWSDSDCSCPDKISGSLFEGSSLSSGTSVMLLLLFMARLLIKGFFELVRRKEGLFLSLWWPGFSKRKDRLLFTHLWPLTLILATLSGRSS